MTNLLDEIDKYDQDIKELKETTLKNLIEAREKRLVEIQTACSHPLEEIVESPYVQASRTTPLSPNVRCCKLCGYTEEGWNFLMLKYAGAELLNISRDELFSKYSRKFYSRAELSKK